MYPFGQDLTYSFYPLIEDAPATIATALQSQTPTIYVFSSAPSRSQAAAGTGAVGSAITSWTWMADRNCWDFTIPAVNDPDPSSSQDTATYYVGVNFKLKTGGQTQTAIRALELVRVRGHNLSVTVSPNDLRDYYPEIDAYVTSPAQLLAYIDRATEDVRIKLRTVGIDWRRITRADRLNTAVTLRALQLSMFAQVQQGNDKFVFKYNELKEWFESHLESLRLEYDSNDDGVADVETTQPDYVLVLR